MGGLGEEVWESEERGEDWVGSGWRGKAEGEVEAFAGSGFVESDVFVLEKGDGGCV